jgi:hypothetical protein
MTGQKNRAHNMMYELSNKPRPEFRPFQEPGEKINVSLKQGVEKYCLLDNFKHISRGTCARRLSLCLEK